MQCLNLVLCIFLPQASWNISLPPLPLLYLLSLLVILLDNIQSLILCWNRQQAFFSNRHLPIIYPYTPHHQSSMARHSTPSHRLSFPPDTIGEKNTLAFSRLT